MYRRDRTHLEEWATLLDVDVCEELLDDESDSLLADERDGDIPSDEAR